MKAPTTKRGHIDWAALEKLWILSKLTPKSFLESCQNVNMKASRTRQNMYRWRKLDTVSIQSPEPKKKPEEPVKKQELRNDGSEEYKKAASAWDNFQTWRQGQGAIDWKLADALRVHVKMLLNTAVTEDKNGKLKSTLDARSMSSIASTLGQIQKIQRLALGMTTEIHGVMEPNSNVKDKDTHKFPTFVVEMDEGKFKRARPRQVS